VLRDAQVSSCAAAIFVADVALTDIAGEYQHFLSRMKLSGVTRAHPRCPSLLRSRYGDLRNEALLNHLLQAVRGLVLLAQNEELRIAPEPRTQVGRITADLTILCASTLEPQVGLTVELVLQMMSERFLRGFVARASQGAIAGTSHRLPFHHDRVPLACVRTDFALACG
jgi:hypothetical protein